MSAAIHIRPATRVDTPAILAMIRELAEFEKLEHLMATNETTLAEELFGAKSPAEALLGEFEGKPVTFAVFFHNFSTFLGKKGLFLEDLYVKPPFRRRGFGRAMLLHVARIAAERNCGRFEWMVLDWNAPAIQFYEKLGATLIHEWKLARVTGAMLSELANTR